MSLKIVKADEPIVIAHPVFLIYGPPGICKTTLGYSTKDPLSLDFDKGSHRAANRRDTFVIDAWADIIEMMESPDILDPYASLTVDTAGRCLDKMIDHIAVTEPKKVQAGNPTQQGWGTLKTMFRTWMSSLRGKGKDVLLIAHDKEDKDGELRIVRPDIVGGSYAEVLKIADFVGYISMNGRDRVIDFNPTDRWIGKNPGRWKPMPIPPVEKATTFMATLFDKGREALGAISEESAKVALQVEAFRLHFDTLTTAEECTKELPRMNELTPLVMPQVKKLLLSRSKALGLVYDKSGKFVAAPAAEPKPETVTQ